MTDHKMAAVDAGFVACPVDTDFRFAPMGAIEKPREEHQPMQESVTPVDNWQVVDVTSSYV
jgi:hypothetical protein